MGQARLILGKLSRAVRVEGTTDRKGRTILLGEGATVPLPDQLAEAVGRARSRRAIDGVLGSGELGRTREHTRRGDVDNFGTHLSSRLKYARKHVIVLDEDVGGVAVEIADSADLGRQVETCVHPRERLAAQVRVGNVSRQIVAARRDVCLIALGEIVQHTDRVPQLEQPSRDSAPDEASSPRDELHTPSPTPNVKIWTPAWANALWSSIPHESIPILGGSMSPATSVGLRVS